MIVLDSTILAYAVGDEHPLRAPCRDVLTAHGDGRIEATTTIEVVVLNRAATALVSADRAFASVPGLRWVDPGTPALRRLLDA